MTWKIPDVRRTQKGFSDWYDTIGIAGDRGSAEPSVEREIAVRSGARCGEDAAVFESEEIGAGPGWARASQTAREKSEAGHSPVPPGDGCGVMARDEGHPGRRARRCRERSAWPH